MLITAHVMVVAESAVHGQRPEEFDAVVAFRRHQRPRRGLAARPALLVNGATTVTLV